MSDEKFKGKIKVSYKGKTRRLPKRYISGLKGSEKTAQIKSIFESKERPQTSFKSRKSNWTQKFSQVYGKKIDKMEGGRTLENISNVTNIPLGAIKAVNKKGMAAYYSGGSRPNQTPESWGKARVYSYIMGGNTRLVDTEVTKKFNVRFRHRH